MFRPPPPIHIRRLSELSPKQEPGFLQLRRARFVASLEQQDTAPFAYDHVERLAIDAVVIAAHFEQDGERNVYLRSSVRPPIALRPDETVSLDAALVCLWELPAGLIEPDESSPEGIPRCAARELEEELGFTCSPAVFRELGPRVYPLPAMIGEFQYFFEVEVSPELRRNPSLDGSPLEQNGEIQAVSLSLALQWCREGRIPDGKTELGLRRLAERWAARE